MKYFITVKFRQDFIRVDGSTITVGVRAKPEKGKANEEVIEKIAAHFGIAKSRVRIATGAKSRRKIVKIN